MTLPEVARRAGVHPGTLDLRWKTKAGLLAEAMLELTARLGPPPDTGTLRGDLERLRDADFVATTVDHVIAALRAP